MNETKHKFVNNHLNRVNQNRCFLYFLQSSSALRPYIGARRSRSYLSNNAKTTSLLNNCYPSTTPLSESTILSESEQNNDLSNAKTASAVQTQEEEQFPLKCFSSAILQDERQPHQQEDQKAKGLLPSTLSSSRFFSPTTHNITPLSVYDHSSSSSSSSSSRTFVTEQQHFHYPSRQYEQHSYYQPLNSEKENSQFTVLEKSEQLLEEQQKRKQPSTNSISIRNPNVDLTDVPEENSLLSSTSFSLTETTVENNNSDNQSYLLTSAPIISRLLSHIATANNKIFPTLLSDKNNNSQLQPLQLDSTLDQSSTISTNDLISDIQRVADVSQLNRMSSLRYSSNLGDSTIGTHPFDQRITDQGNKYIIQLKTDEYQENEFTIKPRYSQNQLVIDAKHREEDSFGGYVHRELHKIFNIPKHIDINQFTYSYNKQTQELTIEMPYLQASTTTNENQHNLSFISSTNNTTKSLNHSYENGNRINDENILSTNLTRSNHYNDSNHTSGIGTTATDVTFNPSLNTTAAPIYESSIGSTKPFDFDLFHRSAFRPQIIRTTSDNNDKKLTMSLDLSEYQPEDIKVSVKDRELIVKAERKTETDTRKSRTSFFQSTSLPPQTDIDHLQSKYIDGKLVIEAPYLDKNSSEGKTITTGTSTAHQGQNWPRVTESQQKTTYDDPFEQRTETITEFVRRLPL
ncbi:unnamed protein product [Rotaria magnacalcarata]|nr:unnamed protein product [Rotaria magnacalcarata]CAF4050796.1 unnamed protein product [Rotaria magnacalcarata]